VANMTALNNMLRLTGGALSSPSRWTRPLRAHACRTVRTRALIKAEDIHEMRQRVYIEDTDCYGACPTTRAYSPLPCRRTNHCMANDGSTDRRRLLRQLLHVLLSRTSGAYAQAHRLQVEGGRVLNT
jgi:hypothetical protein